MPHEYDVKCQCKKCIEESESIRRDMFPNEESNEELEEALFDEWSKDR